MKLELEIVDYERVKAHHELLLRQASVTIEIAENVLAYVNDRIAQLRAPGEVSRASGPGDELVSEDEPVGSGGK